MSIAWFKACNNPDEIRKEYRRLCLLHHPDRGGDTRTMQDINAVYTEALKHINGQTFAKSSSKGSYTYTYNDELEQAVIEKISEFLTHRIAGVNLWLIGSWLWVDGDTKPAKDTLKALGFRWNRKRGKWMWHAGKWHGKHSSADFAAIAAKYGMSAVKDDQRKSPWDEEKRLAA